MQQGLRYRRSAALALGFALVLAAARGLSAAPSAPAAPEITWWTVDGGGGTLSAGGYTLAGTVGQPDAAAALVSGDYSLIGGAWAGMGAEKYPVYLPLVVRSRS
jgi:hypothetical protein